MTIYLIHGFNVSDGGLATTGSLRGGLERAGYEVVAIQYGRLGRLGVRLRNKGIAATLKTILQPDDIVIAHSNGCAITYLAMEMGATCKHVVLINPALDADKEIANVRNVTVFYSPTDKWTWLAKFIPWSPWGAQGRKGFTGKARPGKYRQFNEDKMCADSCGHSGVFHFRRRLITLITGVIR